MRIVRRKSEEKDAATPPALPHAPLTIPVAIPTQLPISGTTRMAQRGSGTGRPSLMEIEQRLHSKIIAELRDSVDLNDVEALAGQIERLFNRFMTEEDVVLSRAERGKVFDQVSAEILGYGPIQQ